MTGGNVIEVFENEACLAGRAMIGRRQHRRAAHTRTRAFVAS